VAQIIVILSPFIRRSDLEKLRTYQGADPVPDEHQRPPNPGRRCLSSDLNLAVARLRHIAGTRWHTKRFLNMKLLKQREITQQIA